MSNCLAQLGFVARYLPTAETARNHPMLVLVSNRKKDTLGVVLRVEIIMSDGLWINWTEKETLQCDRHVSIWGGWDEMNSTTANDCKAEKVTRLEGLEGQMAPLWLGSFEREWIRGEIQLRTRLFSRLDLCRYCPLAGHRIFLLPLLVLSFSFSFLLSHSLSLSFSFFLSHRSQVKGLSSLALLITDPVTRPRH